MPNAELSSSVAAPRSTCDQTSVPALVARAATDLSFVLLDAQGIIVGQGGQALADAPQSWADSFHDDDVARGLPQALLRRACDEGRAEHEGWRLRPDGSQLWASVCIYLVEGGFALVERDLTVRHEAELALEEQREMLGAVLYSASDAVISADLAGRITLFTPAAERVFGHSAKAMLGQPLDVLLPPRHRARHGEDMHAFADSQVSRRDMAAGRVKGLHANGHEIDLEASISQTTVRGQKVLTAILRDVSARVRAEEALVRYQLELSDLTQQLMAQEKTTTRRLAQTLHDQLGQTLTALRLNFDAACAGLYDAMTPERQRLSSQVGTLIDAAIREVRQVLVELRPPLLEEHGLAPAIDNDLRMRTAAHRAVGLVLECSPEVAALRWQPDVEYAAFMVAREAVGNALAHADAATVRVVLLGSHAQLQLEVIDDGRGLPADGAAGKPGHLGMVGMRERAIAIGAHFSAQAVPAGGTSVRLVWQEAT